MSTYLITGGAGFFSSILKEELLKLGHKCISINLEPDDYKHENFIAVQGDIRDYKLLSLRKIVRTNLQNEQLSKCETCELVCAIEPVCGS